MLIMNKIDWWKGLILYVDDDDDFCYYYVKLVYL